MRSSPLRIFPSISNIPPAFLTAQSGGSPQIVRYTKYIYCLKFTQPFADAVKPSIIISHQVNNTQDGWHV